MLTVKQTGQAVSLTQPTPVSQKATKPSILKREVKIKYINTYRLQATLIVLCTILDMGSVFQNCALHFELSGRENVSVLTTPSSSTPFF